MSKKKIGELKLLEEIEDNRTGATLTTGQEIRSKPIWVTVFNGDNSDEMLAYIYCNLDKIEAVSEYKDEIVSKLNKDLDGDPWTTKETDIPKEYGGGIKQVFYMTLPKEEAQKIKKQIRTDEVINKFTDPTDEHPSNPNNGIYKTHGFNYRLQVEPRQGNQIEEVMEKQVIENL